MKKVIIVLTILAGAVVGTQASFFNESFNYPDGGIVANSAGVWVINTGTAGSCLVSNQMLQISSSRTEDIAHQFSPAYSSSTGTDNIYGRFTFMCATNTLPTASGTYFFGFASTAPSFYMARTWVNTTNLDGVTTAPDGQFYIGVGNSRPASSGAWPTNGQLNTLLTSNVWYTVVVRHCLTNGLDTIWVGTDPTTMTEGGTTSATATDAPSATSNTVSYVNFRQAGGEGYLQIKNLKVGATWDDVFFAPEISAIPNQNIPRGGSTAALPFTVGSSTVAANLLTVTATSSNPTLVPDGSPNIVLTSDAGGTNRTITVTPASTQQGSAVITVTVSDGSDTSSTSFTVLVGAPVMSPIAEVVVHTNTIIPPIPFAVFDAENDPITFSVVSAYTNLIKSENIVISGSGPGYTVTLTPQAGIYEWARITIYASDGYSTNSTSFVLTVAPKLGPVFSDNWLVYTNWDVPQALQLAKDYLGNYTPWVTASGTIYEIQVTNDLVYLVSTNTQDMAATLTNNLGGAYGTPYYTSNCVVFYSTFPLNLSDLPTYSGEYFYHLKNGNTLTTGFSDKIFARTNGAAAGKYRLAVANFAGSASATFPLDLDPGTTYTVVTRYNSTTGNSVLWVNPYSELSRSAAATDNPSPTYIGSVGLRQASDYGNLTLGALKIATAWDELGLPVSPPLPAQIPLTLTMVGSNVQLTWSNVYFMLQYAPAITGPWITIPSAVSGYTVQPSQAQQYFRLIAQ